MKIVYSYHPITKEYTGPTEADKSPLEENVWLLPGNSTENAPGETQQYEINVFNIESKNWEVKADYRGVSYWDSDGQEFKITSIGVEPPEGASLSPVMSLAAVKQIKSEQIRQACESDIVSGFTSNALGSPYSYPSDLVDQSNLASSVLASMLPNNPPDWTTPFLCGNEEGEWAFRLHNAAQIQRVGVEAMQYILSKRIKNRTLQTLVEEAVTKEEVYAISWESIE